MENIFKFTVAFRNNFHMCSLLPVKQRMDSLELPGWGLHSSGDWLNRALGLQIFLPGLFGYNIFKVILKLRFFIIISCVFSLILNILFYKELDECIIEN